MGQEQIAYPAHRATDAALRDGTTVHIRPVRPEDERHLLDFLRSLSESSRIFRFFSPTTDYTLTTLARHETRIDNRRHFGLIAPEGVEMIVGVVHDPQFGPVIACGAGGTFVELLKDVSIRLTPLTHEEASEMIRELRTYPLLTGFRDRPQADVGALEDALLRIGTMVEDLHQIAELDCNPIIVHERGAAIVDARIRVAASEPPSLLVRRR